MTALQSYRMYYTPKFADHLPLYLGVMRDTFLENEKPFVLRVSMLDRCKVQSS